MIEPYKIIVPDERLTAIRAKVQAYDWDQLSDAGGWRSGVGLRDLRRLTTTGWNATTGERPSNTSIDFRNM